jgi:hypothetical protein
LHKFFQRNSLSKGLIRTGFAAVYEIFAWGIAFVLAHMPFASYLPFGHRQHKVVEK